MDTENQKYFLDLTDTSEIDTIWFVSFPDSDRDFFAAVYRDAPDRPWTGMFRFRHPDGEKSGGYIRPGPETLDWEAFRQRVTQMFDASMLIAPTPDEHKHRIEIKGDAAKFVEKTHGLSWMEQTFEGLGTTHWPTKES